MKCCIAASLVGLLLVGCAGAELDSREGRPALPQPAQWGALLVSGDGSIEAFDNAVQTMADRLARWSTPRNKIVLVTARATSPAGPSTIAGIGRAAASLKLDADDGCLVFLTSHGRQASGLFVKQDRAILSPRALDRMVDMACGPRPTVVIVSSCFSGLFAEPVMRRPNRILFTAARSDRTSFGCAAGNRYTVFDGCLLTGIDPGRPWWEVADTVRACVAREEARERVTASEPQFIAGGQVRDLAAP